MKVLVTGGAGFVGSHAAEYFASRKHRVVVVDNLMRSRIFGSSSRTVEYNWEYLRSLKNVVLEKNDVRDAAAMDKLFKREKPDVVIHAAGQPGVRFSLENPLEDASINASGTLVVLEALRKANSRGKFIFCSTNKVYGNRVNTLPLRSSKKRYEFRSSAGIDEKFGVDLTGHTPYGVSKLAGDLYVQDYAYAYGIKSAVYRMSCIYGTRQFGFEDQGWLAWFTIKCLQGAPVTIYGDGRQIRDVLWADDLVAAFDAFIRSEKPLQGEVFNIGGGVQHTLSLLELVDHLKDITQKPLKVKFDDWRKFDQKVYVSDISKARRVLGWKPKVGVREGIERLVDWVNGNMKVFCLCAVLSLVSTHAFAAGPQVCFKDSCVGVETVSKPRQLERGLSGRKGLDKDSGMLFVFPSEGVYRFWMKDMKFALDIIWMDGTGTVVAVGSGLQPCTPSDCPVYAPPQGARYVLEVRNGFAETHGITVKSKAELKGIYAGSM